MKSGLYALVLSALVAAPTFAYQLSPTPEAGLWRSENRTLIGSPNPVRALDEAAMRLSDAPPAEHRALRDQAIKEASPIINMECLTAQQAVELFEQGNFQQEMKRKVPECELTVHPVDPSTLSLQGRCDAHNGFNGEIHGHMEIVSSLEFQTSFLGTGRMPMDPHDANSQLQDVSIQRDELFLWSAADCGEVLPRERLSF